MIHYLGNAANEVQYTDRNGVVVTLNPFDPRFVLVSQRVSLQMSNAAENQQRRNHYEESIHDANLNIDAGRPAPVTLPVPLHINTPEDFNEPVDEDTNWDPPLLTLKRAAPLPSQSVGVGPDSPARPHPLSHIPADVAATVVTLIGSVGPALPSLIELLQALLHHGPTPPVTSAK